MTIGIVLKLQYNEDKSPFFDQTFLSYESVFTTRSAFFNKINT